MIPAHKTVNLIKEIHVGLKHMGRNKVFEYMKTYFHFKNMRDSIGDELKNCLACKMYKDKVDKNDAPHKKIYTTGPFQKLCIDLAEMPKSRRGHKYILVVIDHFSKWVQCVALKNKEGTTLANCLEKIILPACQMIPQEILSDNGTEFKNKEMTHILKKYAIQRSFSPAYYPQNNGLAERTIGTIKTLLRTSEGDWEQNLASVVITYNHSFHEAIDMSPADLFAGRRARIIIPDKNLDTVESYEPYKVGDKVLRKVVAPTKMGKRYEPGYVISRVNASKRTYGVIKELDKSFPETKVHHNQLILNEQGLPQETQNTDAPENDENVQNLKYLAHLTIKPKWEHTPKSSQHIPHLQSTYLSCNNSRDLYTPPTSPAGSQFSGFTDISAGTEPEVRRRMSCRPKRPVDRFCPG